MTTRDKIVAEAASWIGTPFHHEARIKGVGVDCANLLVGVYSNVGLVPGFDIEHYPPDWHKHKDEPRFLAKVMEYCDKLPEGETPQPGDVAMFSFGRHAAHGAIVAKWPMVIHAWIDVGSVVMTEANQGPLGKRLVGVFRLRGLE